MGVTLRAVVGRESTPVRPTTGAPINRRRVRVNRLRLMSGILFVALAAGGGNLWASQQSRQVSVFVMTRNLAAGSVVTPTDFEIHSIGASDVSAYASSDTDLVGQRIRRDMFAGEYIPLSALMSPADTDLREVSIPLVAGHSPMVDAGQLVDIWMTPSTDGVAVPGPAQLILSNAVIATGLADFDPTLDAVATVIVAPDDVHLVVEAMQSGTVTLVAVKGNLRRPENSL